VNGINGTLGNGTASASIVSGPGSFVGGVNTCNYTGGAATASCTVVITSAVAGTTVVSATSNIAVSGQTITRTTNTAVNTAAGGSGNASKTWEAPPPSAGAFTPGYWKNHEAHTTSLLPITLGNFAVGSFTLARDVFGEMNCGSSKPQAAIGCLAGHLLASKLNVKNGADTCIQPTIDKADAFLKGQTVDGVPGITYTGPTGTYTLTAAQRALVLDLKDKLDKYDNGGGC